MNTHTLGTTLSIIWYIAFLFFIIRLFRIYRLQNKLTKLVYKDIRYYQARRYLIYKHSYSDMLIKFWRPIKMKYWFSKYEIDILNGVYDHTISGTYITGPHK